MNRKAFAAFSSLLLLVGGAAAWQMTGTVDTNFDALLEDASEGDWQCLVMNSYYLPECTKPIDIEVGGSTTSEVKWSIANSAAVATDNREQVLGATEKRLNASYGVAMAEAKQESIEDLNAGASEAVATSNASDVIRDWYSKIQRNTLNYRNRHVLKLNASLNEAEKTSGLNVGDVIQVKEVTGGSYNNDDLGWDGINNWRIEEKNKTLYNGENATIYSLEVHIYKHTGGGSCSSNYEWINFHNRTSYTVTADDGASSGCQATTSTVETAVSVVDPEGNRTRYFNGANYVPAVSDVTGTKDRAVSNTQNVVSNIFSTYSQGDVNVSSSLGPLEVLKTASTSYSSTGYYDYATLTAKQMGLQTNDSYAFEIKWSQEGSNKTHSDIGQLFLDDSAFNGTLEAGKQYNVTDQTVWFTHTASNGNIAQEELNGTFTILEMTDKESGETVSSTSTQDIKVYESNVTDLENQLQSLQEQLEEYQNETRGAGGGSGSGFLSGLTDFQLGLSTSMMVILGLLLVIAGVVIS